MSAHIGTVHLANDDDEMRVYASRGGVELIIGVAVERHSTDIPTTPTLTPISARALAALLVAASEEVERMRRTDPEGPKRVDPVGPVRR